MLVTRRFLDRRRFLARLIASLVACLAVAAAPSVARAEMVYVVSQSAGTLLRFDPNDTGTQTTVETLVSGLFQPSALTVGPDGHLYLAEWGDGDTIDPRISRYDIGTGTWAVVASLNPVTQDQPASIAFRPAGLGGEMLVGRTGPFGSTGEGGIVSISGWDTVSPNVSSTPFNMAPLNGSSGLAVAADGTTYVSNSQYVDGGGFGVYVGNVVRLNASGDFVDEVIADGFVTDELSGPAGLILDGSTLYTGSVTNSMVFTTDLGALPSLTAFGDAGGNFDAGPLAMLSDGSILTGSLTGLGIFRYDSNGLSPAQTYSNGGFGLVGGLAVAPVPEPSTLALVGLGIAGGCFLLRSHRRATMRK